MNAAPMLKPLKAVVALALLLGSVNGSAASAALESFERMLAHQPGPAAPVTAAGRDADPLTRAIVIRVRDGVEGLPVAADPVVESFARMLAHTPSADSPAVPSHLGPDPLTAALVEPLRQSIAASAAAPRVSKATRVATKR